GAPARGQLEQPADPGGRLPRGTGPVGPGEGGATGRSVGRGPRLDAPDAGVPHPAAGDVDDAPEGDLVVGVHQDAQVGEHVIDLAPVVDARPAGDDVGDVPADELLLDHPALGVGAVEHGDVAPPAPPAAVQTR